MAVAFPLRKIKARAYTIPAEEPESDGTLEWSSTTLVLVEAEAGGKTGLGFTYTDAVAAALVREKLAPLLLGKDATDIPSCWDAVTRAERNLGRPGLGLMAVSALDFALWDLKSKLLGIPLHRLLGRAREEAPLYGSGGFTSYSIPKLCEQLAGWVDAGIPRVKMKVGRDAARDEERVKQARLAIGANASLFVDANGAYKRKQALELAVRFREAGVAWFEEPVSSDDLEGLRMLRDRCPHGMEVAAGEYGFDAPYFARMLQAQAVDVVQADATRCGGVSGFLRVLSLAHAAMVPLSAHTAPSMHVALACHSRQVIHLEYFHDHARIEHLLFDGALAQKRGTLKPDDSVPGFGLVLKSKDAEEFAA
jgi:L-alanine-DL-glutamate epimerase-like enolase superfamily enzyme